MLQRNLLRSELLKLPIQLLELVHFLCPVAPVNRLELRIAGPHPVPDRLGPDEFERVVGMLQAQAPVRQALPDLT